LEIEERFAALKLDLNPWGRTLKSNGQSTFGRILSHIKTRTICTLAGNLTIWTRVLAAQCHHKQVEGCRCSQEGRPASKAHRQELKLTPLAFPRDQVRCIRLFVKAIPGRDPQVNQPIKLAAIETEEVTDQVGDEISVGARPLKPEGQERDCLFSGMEVIRGLESSHAFPPIQDLSSAGAANEPNAKERIKLRTGSVLAANRSRRFSSVTRSMN
jgi:hypothetical protein